LLGFSLESLLIDNDIIGAVQRTIRGIEVNDETLSLDTIRDVCLTGPGHYLGAPQTLKLMQKDYLYPQVANRSSPNQWVEQGRPSLIETASKKLQFILDSHYPSHISPEMDAQLRADFPVRLAREGMLPK
jgi:trimethylamine--corrinoid protein Co-methyltransferase